jgi:CHAT domain-containing protein/tetratricopeptide (TPR) repeat protein
MAVSIALARLGAIALALCCIAAQASDLATLRALYSAGKFLEAEEAGLQAAARLEAERGPADLEIADTLDVVLDARRTGRRLTIDGSVALAERALRIKEAALGQDDARVATTLVLLGAARSANRDHAGARQAMERALAIQQRAFGPDHLEVAATLNALGGVFRVARDYPQAAQAAQRALFIARQLEQPAGNETAAALSTLGIVDRANGDLERAVSRSEEMLVIDERLRGPAHPAIVGTLLNLSGALWDLGDVDRSRALHERALRILDATPGSDRRLAFELVSLASKLENTGDFANGLTLCERGAAIAERLTGPNSMLTAAALDELAALRNHLGDVAGATALRQRTLAIWSAQGAETLHVAIALNALAESYEDAGQIDEAFDAVERSLRIKALEDENTALSRVLQTKARLLSRRGRLAEARVVLQRARDVSEATANITGRVDLAMTLRELARVEEQDGQPARAVPLYRDAVRLFERELGPTYIRTAERRAELAGALAKAGDFPAAREELIAAEQASVDHLRLIARALTDRRALSFAAARVSGADLAVTMATRPAAKTKTDVEAAWQMVIRGRTIVLDEMAARQRAVAADADRTIVRERWAALNRSRSRLANLIIRGPEALAADQYRALVERTRDERDRAERDLAEASVTFRQEQTRLRAGASDVLAALPAGAALVSYVRYTPHALRGVPGGAPGRNTGRNTGGDMGDNRGGGQGRDTGGAVQARPAYAAFIVRAGSPTVRIVALGSADTIEAAVNGWRDRIQAELTAGGLASRRNEAAYRQAGHALRARIWAPIRPFLTSARSVFVVPDGALHLVDFATLPTGTTTYLVEAPLTVHYLLAERDLVQPPSEPRGASLLALGAPDFDKVDRVAAETPASLIADAVERPANPGVAADADDAARTRSLASRSACDALAHRTFAPLPATRDEMQHIADLWRQGAGSRSASPRDVLLLGDDRATEAAFKTLAPGRRVLHLATHGFFLDRFCGAASPAATTATATAAPSQSASRQAMAGTTAPDIEESPLLRAGLVLAGANRRAQTGGDEEDGILTAEEIAGLDLSAAEWAVLSACDTGRGDWQTGEGIVGLRRAFQVAGARTVILSLWPVIDTVASEWMAELYRGKFVGGLTTSAAVRDADRALLARRRAAGQSTHPLYWTGFIATGDWR